MWKGNSQSYWDLMTFKSITSVMNHGVTKQLDFEDLLRLPADMDPLSCHNRLLSCWQDQQIKNCSNPSLFRAICYAYGWPYVRLGLLKVFIYLRESFLIICWNLQEYEFIDILISILILPLIPVVFFFVMLEKKT